PDAATIGLIRARQKVDQCRLAGAVRADDADAIAAQDACRKVVDDPAIAIGSADAFCFDHQLAGLFRFRGGEVGITDRAAIIPACRAHRLQMAEALDIALPAAGDAITQPMLFLDDLAIELVLLALFLSKHLVAPALERGKPAIDPPDRAAIEPGGCVREV